MEAFDRISTPQKVLILLLIMMTIGVLYYFLVYSDQEDQLAAAVTQKKQLVEEQSQIQRKVAKQQDLEVEVEELRSQTARIEKALPQRAEIQRLLQQVYGQAKIVGLKIKRFEPGKETPQPLYTEIPVAMELQGTFEQVTDFFFNVGKMERVVNIKNISMNRVSGQNYGSGELSVTCQAITYRSGGTDAAVDPNAAGDNARGKQGLQIIHQLYKGTGAIK